MVTDGQVRRLLRELDSGTSLAFAARRTGMSDKTARNYRDNRKLPSARLAARRQMPRTYRTRPDPFAEVWPAVEEQLAAEPRLVAKTLFDWLRQQHPGRFFDSHRRTFERRVRQWRALHGPGKAIMFRQIHDAGDLAASDFTNMNSLNITIAGQPFDHLVYHFVLTYSNWESVTVCASESFEALSDGLQNALWELGGVPRRHRSDSLTAAVNNLSATREFQTRYRDLLRHYGLVGQRINVRQAHENGDAESSHGHFKTAVDQALLLRGSRDFAGREEYASFLQSLVKPRNAGRQDRFAEESAVLNDLPDARVSSCLKVRCRVDSGSLIHIHRNIYSVHSRLIGEWVEARLFADRVEVWYADQCVETRPRLVGRDRHAVNYRHVIDSLVRKPGAFAQYAYRDDLFPTTRFRMAYDRFCEGGDERRGAKAYLKVLHHATHNNEVAIDDALRLLLASDRALSSADAVIALAQSSAEIPAATEVVVELPDLKEFDALLTLTEEFHGEATKTELGESTADAIREPDADADGLAITDSGIIIDNPSRLAADLAVAIHNSAPDRAVAATSTADDPRPLPESGGPCCPGELQLPEILGSADEPGSRGAHAGPHPPHGDGLAIAAGQDLGPVSLVAAAQSGAASVPGPPRRRLPGPPRERLNLRQAGFRKNARHLRGGRATRVAWASRALRDVQLAGAGPARRQTRSEARTLLEEVGRLRGPGHRRPRLRPTEPRRDGGPIHTAGRALRAGQRDVNQQFAVFERPNTMHLTIPPIQRRRRLLRACAEITFTNWPWRVCQDLR